MRALGTEAGEGKHSKDPLCSGWFPFYRKIGDLARGRRIFVCLYKKQAGFDKNVGAAVQAGPAGRKKYGLTAARRW